MIESHPYTIELPKRGNEQQGFLTVAQNEISFNVKRSYWIYGADEAIERGGHAFHKNQSVLVCLQGTVIIELFSRTNEKCTYTLDSPNKLLYVPPYYWKTFVLTPSTIIVSFASEEYNEQDYIRDKDVFLKNG